MSLRHRLSKLEDLLPVVSANGEGQSKLLAHLNTIADRLEASGEVEDRTDASPAERIAMAMVRGDADTVRALLSAAVGRELGA